MQDRLLSECKAPDGSLQRLGVLRSFRLRGAPQHREGAKAAAAFVTFGDSESAILLRALPTNRECESSNPNGIPSQSPGLARRAYPGNAAPSKSQPQRGCGSKGLTRPATPLGLKPFLPRFPRVARGSQPWALLRNPFGIRRRTPTELVGIAERKLPQSKTWRRFERLMDSFLHPLAVRGDLEAFRKPAERWRQKSRRRFFCPHFSASRFMESLQAQRARIGTMNRSSGLESRLQPVSRSTNPTRRNSSSLAA